MKRLFATIVCCCSFLALTSGDRADRLSALKGPYLGQKPPGMVPEVFAPGIVSVATSWDAAISFSPDGREIYFSRRKTLDGGENRILFMEIRDGVWTSPAPAPFARDLVEYEAFVAPDGKRIFFHSARPASLAGDAMGKIWYSERGPAGWGEPRYLTPRINRGWVMFVTAAANNTLYFNAVYDRSLGIYRSLLSGGEYQPPELVTLEAGSPRGAHPFIASDESYLIYDAQPEAPGRSHLYVSFRKDNKWTKSVKFGPAINATATEAIATVSPDGKYLFFGRNNDIYWVDARVIEDLRPQGGTRDER